MTDGPRRDPPCEIPDAGVLSNRQKNHHGEGRGLDGKNVQTEQLQDHASNHLDDGKV